MEFGFVYNSRDLLVKFSGCVVVMGLLYLVMKPYLSGNESKEEKEEKDKKWKVFILSLMPRIPKVDN